MYIHIYNYISQAYWRSLFCEAAKLVGSNLREAIASFEWPAGLLRACSFPVNVQQCPEGTKRATFVNVQLPCCRRKC